MTDTPSSSKTRAQIASPWLSAKVTSGYQNDQNWNGRLKDMHVIPEWQGSLSAAAPSMEWQIDGCSFLLQYS